MFGYENQLVSPIYVSDQTFKSSIDLLLLINDDQSDYVYVIDFNTFMFHQTKNKNTKYFCRSCLQCFRSENVLIKHKEDRLSINGQQSINVEKGTLEFRNYFKQLPVPFKIYAEFECNFKVIVMLNVINLLTQKNILSMFLVVMLIKLFVLMIDLIRQLLFIELKMLLMNLLNQFLKNISTVKKL